MKVLALMQNQWFKDAEGVRRIMARYDALPEAERMERRRLWIRRTLFMGCRSGRVLASYIGGTTCDRIIWEEASTSIGDDPKHCPPPEPEHIRAVFNYHAPALVVTFGRLAELGYRQVWNQAPEIRGAFEVIHAPHPACRAPKDHATLKEACTRLRELIANAAKAV